ncbi:hypothetical protein BDZ94DRAFT_1169173 [Collybia nuda]|uniref:BTB domain-containing protein n=1 Tax=Collybia nuda TaxID=64659 RepID=A0A9P5Y1T4_9AGAR|nr:hypothetical protein BDZ94DRAFT_1169173 [Collybia nuda]
MTTHPQISPDEPGFKELQQHPTFYIHGADLTFVSGNILFRVHRYFFDRESRVFREQVLPTSGATSKEGYTDATAISIDVPADDFAQLLGIFYNPTYSLYDLSISDWTCVLALAHNWEFNEVKNLAVRELQKQDLGVVERIALYQTYKVDAQFLVPLYAILCSRDEPPNDEEADALGSKTAIRVYRARERLRAQSPDGGRSPLPEGIGLSQVYDTLSAMFGMASPVSSPIEDKAGELNG